MKASGKKPSPGTREKKSGRTSGGGPLRYKALFEHLPHPALVIDADGNILAFNEAAHRQLGYSREEFAGLRLPDVFVAHTGEKPQSTLDEFFASEQAEFDIRQTTKNGDLREVRVFARRTARPGTPVVYASWHERAPREQPGEKLRNIDEPLGALIRYAPLAIVCTDVETNVLIWNSAAERIFGWMEHEVLGKKNPIVPEEKRNEYMRLLDSVRRGEAYYSKELIRQRKDGTLLHLQASSAALSDTQGAVVAYIGIFEDVTEQKLKEEAIRESEERFRGAFENAAVGASIVDLKGRFLKVNKRLCEMLGYPEKVLLSKTFSDISHPEDVEIGLEALRKLIAGEAERLSIEKRYLRGDGSGEFLRIMVSPSVMRDKNGKAAGCLGLWQDVTTIRRIDEELRMHREHLAKLVEERTEELKTTNERLVREIAERERMEEELIKAQNLESLAVLAGGIAHDFNNMLTTSLGNVSLSMLYLDREHEAYQQLSLAEGALLRAQDLTRQLLTFSKGGAPLKQIVSLRELIREGTGFALRGSRVRCDISIPEDLWMVRVDCGQISQVLHNLMINADQAMPRGGTIEVRCENVVLPPGTVQPPGPGNHVKLTVRDNGVGIAKEHLHRIFDPYFTTKKRGSGLGLATTYSIIKKHDGHISVESEPGKGTSFIIFLRAAEGPAPSPIREGGPVQKAEGRVLLMDDEAEVRQTTGDVLKRLGYSVVFAENGGQAIDLYQDAMRSAKPFDAVILDLTIPAGMGGKETVGRLRELDPDLKAIVSSGYSNDPIMADYQAYGFAGVVAKPYRIKQLGETLVRVISGPPPGPGGGARE